MEIYDKIYYEKNKERIKSRTKTNCGGKGIQGTRLKAKQLCRKLANYTCQICGGEGLDAHHLIPVEQGGSDEQSNLICVCRSCHQKIHHNTLVFKNGEWQYITAPSKYIRSEEFIPRRDYRKEIDKLRKYYHDYNHPEHVNLEIWHTLCQLSRNFNYLTLEEIERVLTKYRNIENY